MQQEELASLGVTMNEFMPKWPFNFIIQEKKKMSACNCNFLVLLCMSVLGQQCLWEEAQPEEPQRKHFISAEGQKSVQRGALYLVACKMKSSSRIYSNIFLGVGTCILA